MVGLAAGLVEMQMDLTLVWQTCGWPGIHTAGMMDVPPVLQTCSWSDGHVASLVDMLLVLQTFS